MASCGLPGVRRGRRRDAVNDPPALGDEDPAHGARQRNLTHKFARLRAGLGGPFFQFKDPRARRPLLGGAFFQFKPEAGRVAFLVADADFR